MTADEPNWLTEEQLIAWRQFASVLMKLPSRLNAQMLRDAGITHFEYAVLAALSESPDRTMRMSELASQADAALPRLSQVASRLEDRGWVKRHTDPNDARCNLATLTDDGWDKVVASAPGHVNEVRRLVIDTLTPAQVSQLQRISERITDAIDSDL